MAPDVGWTWPSTAAGFVAPAVTPDGVLAAFPLVGAGVVTVAPVLGGVLGTMEDGAVLFGVVTVAPGLGATVLGAAALGFAVAGGAGSAIAPGDVVVVTPAFFDVSGCVVC
ncbi:MAG TPA: hypothetical protein VFS59_03380 [Gemmatimonadaceae bacterium]|nr:hypothetical protein [Gemmatimonadaceae bacterium]